MKTIVVETIEKQNMYISEDGLKTSKYCSVIEDYENKLRLAATIEQAKVRSLTKDTIDALRYADVYYGRILSDIYKVNSYEEFELLVHQIEQLNNAKAFRGDIDEYVGYTTEEFSSLEFFFAIHEEYNTADRLTIYTVDSVKAQLIHCADAINKGVAALKNETNS